MGMLIRLPDYLAILAANILKAENRSDKDECIRLGRVLINTVTDYVVKVEQTK